MDYDVIVIGGGGAGMSAAVEAANQGARVLIVEAGDSLGGSTALSGGVYYAAGTEAQRAQGIEDSADDMFRYYMTLNQYRVEPSLVRRLCDEAAAGLEWLEGMGAEFPAANLYQSGVDGIKRGHRCEQQGAGIAQALEAAISQKGLDVALQTRVRDLLRDDTGRVTGIRVDGADVTAHSVVLATGGFGANPEMLAHLYPEAASASDWAWYIGVDTCRGDGIEMATAAGGEVVGHDRGLLLITPGFARDTEPYMPGWLVYVNRDGRRFIDETTEYSVVSGVVKAQPASECFAVFDEAARLASKPPAHTVKNPWSNPQWSGERLAQLAKDGRIFSADTLAELGEKAGIRPGALATTIESYNASASRGEDDMFFKGTDHLRQLTTPPYYAARLRSAIVCLTATGIRIDVDGQVLDRADQVIEGLYAAGETTGGVMGERYIGGGNSITNAIVFGRIAGASAARTAQVANTAIKAA
ncbi:MAG: FAD-dependent oxidoreductase [Pseudomonadota bacterium]|nr:FAD-dependent oxidoreductase [Pseudomonadota bacterium]